MNSENFGELLFAGDEFDSDSSPNFAGGSGGQGGCGGSGGCGGGGGCSGGSGGNAINPQLSSDNS